MVEQLFQEGGLCCLLWHNSLLAHSGGPWKRTTKWQFIRSQEAVLLATYPATSAFPSCISCSWSCPPCILYLPYSASLTKSSFAGSNLTGFKNNGKKKWPEMKTQKLEWATSLAGGHVQFGQKANIFRMFQGHSLPLGIKDCKYESSMWLKIKINVIIIIWL